LGWQEDCGEVVFGDGAEKAKGTAEEKVIGVSGPGADVGVVVAEGEGLVPYGDCEDKRQLC